MSYIGEVRRTAFSSFGTMASGLLVAGFKATLGFAKAVYHRHTISQLGQFDDRMLKDIGLTRADLRDAASGPLWQDPTAVLVVRAVERRANRRNLARAARQMPADETAAPASDASVMAYR
ncbi:DUF1127 domain-containing protein [Ancylobacter sp. A5.8]|uniref:DUF1127 domain-containing protein n=1 Tax=Ancylobacter gelatini TaxID=2919920 RepID=UPI001F4DCB6B|nr:DUF1127 domain-containing protein [Ancylobacter gelatini]MCJ8145003.1 DUF1127 domain-containing protein [Ancylobacter gelatini]